MIRSRTILTFCALSTLTACGWGYAGKTYKNQTEDYKQQVVIVEEKTPPPPVVSNEPCKTSTFTVHFLEEKHRSTKSIQCTTGQILSITRDNISTVELQRARIDNLPLKQWYLLVDPNFKGYRRPNTITNDELLGLKRLYNIEFFQRQSSTGLIVYLFKSSP